MSEPVFQAPSFERMNSLLPAFEFNDVLSSNAIGAVYYALQKSLDRHVAIKLFSPRLSGIDGFRGLFVESTSAMATLRHPNLIGVYDSGTVEGMAYVVMEFVPGKSLARSTKGHAIEFSQSMAIIRQVCEGMAYAHSKRVVHGHLSPLDILLNQQAAPKIGNFGLGASVHTLADVEVPVHFTAPEVLAGGLPTAASDLYSLAAIFYQLITGTRWRPGGPRASELEGSPAAVDDVIDRAGARDPEQRRMDPLEFYHSLEKAARDKPRRRAAAAAAERPLDKPKPVAAAQSAAPAGREDSKLLTKVVVILVLLIAIQQAWSHRQYLLKREPETVRRSSDAEEVQTVEFAQVQPPAPPVRQVQPPAPPVNPPGFTGFPEDAETPMDSLGRLRDLLRQGSRNEMPMGTFQAGDKSYFLVSQAMTWPQAVAYAEDHGGHLALPDGGEDWSRNDAVRDQSLWIGAARSGAETFTRLDGMLWSPGGEGDGSEPFVYRDRSGGLRTAGAEATKPFLIAWHADGTNPATLEAQLRATAGSLKSSRPVYPPATLTAGERRYLAVARAVSWEEARRLAESGGGHLLALSDEGELALAMKAAALCPASGEFWLGGHLVGHSWVWSSGEPWRAVSWLSERSAAEDDAAMLLRAGSGLDARRKTDTATGFVIEWSSDPSSNKAPAVQSPAAGDILAELTLKARELVIQTGKDKEAAHAKNTAKLAWDLDAHVRGLNKSSQQQLAPDVETLKGCVQNNRLFKETVEASGVSLTPFMAKLCNYIIEKQGRIDQDFATSLQSVHVSYRAKLTAIRDQAKQEGQIKAQVRAEELLQGSENFDAWVSSMSSE